MSNHYAAGSSYMLENGGYYDEYGGYYDPGGNYYSYNPQTGEYTLETPQVSDKIPAGNAHDAEGRLLAPKHDDAFDPEPNLKLFTSLWRPQRMASVANGPQASSIVWPHIKGVVKLQRLDLYESDTPVCQQGTTDLAESRRIRHSGQWRSVLSLFLLDQPMEYTKQILIESAGPPRRSKFIPSDKRNPRDLTKWLPKEIINAFIGTQGIPGTLEYFVDFRDTPDRYFINLNRDPAMGTRRMYRFAAYPVTQYYILEKEVYHQCLDAEGGSGLTVTIESGPVLYARKHWRLIGSFFGFDMALPGSNKYRVYKRDDPFPRMMIAVGNIERAEEWTCDQEFYSFDVPLPNTTCYQLQHSIRSIYSTAANVPRHRLTSDDARIPWEFRMDIHVFPANLEDCTIVNEW